MDGFETAVLFVAHLKLDLSGLGRHRVAVVVRSDGSLDRHAANLLDTADVDRDVLPSLVVGGDPPRGAIETGRRVAGANLVVAFDAGIRTTLFRRIELEGAGQVARRH